MGFSNMAAAHNTFIQGLNAMIRHGPTVTEDKVEPFMWFCLALVRLASVLILCPFPHYIYTRFSAREYSSPPLSRRNILFSCNGRKIRRRHSQREHRRTWRVRSKTGSFRWVVQESAKGWGSVWRQSVFGNGRLICGYHGRSYDSRTFSFFFFQFMIIINSLEFNPINYLGTQNLGPRYHSRKVYHSRTQSYRQWIHETCNGFCWFL